MSELLLLEGGIYQIRNLVNNKIYVGSSVSLKERRDEHLKYHCNSNKPLQAAIKKYGTNNFKFEILELCKKEFLIEREQYYLDTLKPEYNICKIAGNTTGYKFSEDVKQKIKNILKEKMIGENNPFYNKHHSAETKRKISLKKVGELSKSAKLSWKSVNQIREEYKNTQTSNRKLAKKYNVGKSTIQQILTNQIWRIS